ncbi:proteinase-activated receptor 1-like [Hemicordylus capensis]|uniref:proteinase-activated receptor 1-like n=1 Tax=Hemicordylus capensis TaxID=884348 RepID=UPI00230481D9|nr:proteinase-activated receptor 1-like [Hemicordylus capensis]XP_053144317.1 proteinase-activated receptor 1-like [Hemicordylus capensis]XP_053144318.1 proteinase-activated receptor 1-like [Hemicordylus capensis]XP_053144319.1 proteinase-activated receptor 1-like [Hemicordylus capensis]
MDPSLKILLSLLSVPHTLFSTARADKQNSSLEFQFSSFFYIDEMIENESGNSSLNITQLNHSEDIERYLTSLWLACFVPSVHTFVVVLSLPLNIIAILIFVTKIQLKKPAVVYMLNLASADVLFVSVLPFQIVYRFSGHNWIFGPEMCRFVTAAFYSNMYCSILLMMVISVDRFLAVVYPMQSLSWRTVRRAYTVCLAIWIAAIAGVIPLLMTDQTKRLYRLNITTCHDVLDLSVTEKFRSYWCTLSVLFFFIPFIISATCYVGIIRKLSSSNVAAKAGKRRRAVLLSAAVLCSFILCFGPTNVTIMVHNLSDREQWQNLYFAYLLAVCTGAINCCIDPLIYFYASLQCQRHVYNLLGCKKHSDVEKDSQTTSSNMATFSSGLNSLSQA